MQSPHAVNGDTVRVLRQLKKYKQQFVAKKMGITQQRYSKFEQSQKVSEVCFQKILKALDYTPAEFEKVKNFLPPPR